LIPICTATYGTLPEVPECFKNQNGSNSEDELLQNRNEFIQPMSSANLELGKWVSNTLFIQTDDTNAKLSPVKVIAKFKSDVSGCFMLGYNLLAKEYSRRDESAFNVEIRIRTDLTKGQPSESWAQECYSEQRSKRQLEKLTMQRTLLSFGCARRFEGIRVLHQKCLDVVNLS